MSEWDADEALVLDAYVDDDDLLAADGMVEATAVPTATALDSDDGGGGGIFEAHYVHYDGPSSGSRRYSAYLYDLTRQGTDWSGVIERCMAHPEEARHTGRTSRRTALHEACRAGAPLAVVAALVDAYASAAAHIDAGGSAPLHLVFSAPDDRRSDGDDVGEDRCEVVQYLLDAFPGAAGIQDDRGSNPLMKACDDREADPNVVQALLLARPRCARAVDRQGKTALARYGEARGASLAVARLLLDAYPEATARVDAVGGTPLHRPAFDGNVNLVESILLRDESIASVRDQHGRTALHRACQCFNSADDGRLEVVRLLLDADPGASSVADRPSGRVPLHYACRNRSPDVAIVRCILEVDGTCSSAVDSAGRTPLHDACANIGTEDIVALLLEVAPSLARMTSKKADMALHHATELNQAETVKMLMEVYPDAALARNDYGFTPLHCVCRSYNPSMDIVRVLLTCKPECATITTNGGELPLHLACLKPNVSVDVVRALLDASGDCDMSNKAGNTPLHDACFHHSSLEVIKVLATSHPGWVALTNASGYSPLHLTCKTGTADEGIVQMLLETGGPDAASVVDCQGHSLLHSSCHSDGSPGIASALIQAYPPSTELTTAFGDTALHLACMRNVPFDVLLAVARGGDQSCVVRPNHNGLSPLHIVMRKFRNAAQSVAEARSPREIIFTTEIKQDLYSKATALIEQLYPKSSKRTSILRSSLSVRRQFGSALVPHDFIAHVLKAFPKEVQVVGDDGNLPLHIEAGVRESVDCTERTADGTQNDFTESVERVLELLLEHFPEAAQKTNASGQFPIDIAMESGGRKWGTGIKALLVAYPPALVWQETLDRTLLPFILEKVGRECDYSTLFQVVRAKPDLAKR